MTLSSYIHFQTLGTPSNNLYAMVNIRELRPDLAEKARKELHEDPARVEADITALRDWLKKQTYIRANPDDQTLVTFLRGCKFSLERTKEKLDTYYTIRTAVPEFFKDSTMQNQKLMELLHLGVYLHLPGLDDLGRRVVIMRLGLMDPHQHRLEDQFKLSFMMMDMLLHEDDDLSVSGIVSVVDLSNVSFGHVAQFTPPVVKKLMSCSQNAYPVRPKGVNYIHTPPMFESAFNLFQSLIKDKMKQRNYVHGDNLESLYKNIPQRILPTEYGGQAGSIREINDAFIKRMEAYRDRFVVNALSGVDEKKRPASGQAKTQKYVSGLDGSFRQLNVD